MGDNRTSEKRSWANDEGETSQENPAAASSSTRLPEKLEECIRDFSSFKDPSKIDDLIRMIKELLQTSQQPDNASTSSQVTGKIDEKRSMLTCFTKSGSKFLKSFNERLEKTGIKKYSKEGTKVATEILQLVGQTHWLVGGLSMIAYLISTTDKMSENRTECLELLGCMIELAERLKSWKNMVPQHEEKFADAIQVIVEGSVTCASQLKSNRFFRFLKASVNSEALGSLRRKISETKDDLVLINCIESLSQRPGDRPITKPDYPDKAGFNLFKDPNKRGTIKFEDLQRVLKICVGIQLALKIVGAQKRGTIKDEKPSECLVDFVYGELHESTQEAFLDICCFFSNWNRQDVEYIVGKEEVASLLETKLITSTPEGNDLDAVFPHSEKLIVDGIIKAKGRSLANGSRIMDVQSLSEVLADKERLPHVKGIWLAEDQSEYVIEGKHLNLMSKSLRVLSLGERMKVSRPSQMKFEELRFLGVGGDNTELLVKSEVFDKLRVFHGPFFVGGEVSLHKLPKSLLAMKVKKQTDGTDCTNSQMTGALPCCLEKLDFSELSELPQLPEGFNQLESLKFLNLDGVSQMRELPEQICQLPALETLTMRNCLGLEGLPPSFGHLSTLTCLDLSGCQSLQKLPYNFRHLSFLKHLVLSGCPSLEKFPDTFGHLSTLTHLDLSGCPSLKELPDTFGQLSTLTHLSVSCCPSLEKLPDTFGQLSALRALDLSGCQSLKELPYTFGQLRALETLIMRECLYLKGLPPSFGHLSTLTHLDLYGCEVLEELPDTFGQLRNLRDLNLIKTAVKTLPSNFGQLKSLQRVECPPALEGIVQRRISGKVKINVFSRKAVSALPKKNGGIVFPKSMTSSPLRASIFLSPGK